LFLFGSDCMKAGRVVDRPEPPEIVRALVRAKDRRAAFDALEPIPFSPTSTSPSSSAANSCTAP
jgi:hypothetical protein